MYRRALERCVKAVGRLKILAAHLLFKEQGVIILRRLQSLLRALTIVVPELLLLILAAFLANQKSLLPFSVSGVRPNFIGLVVNQLEGVLTNGFVLLLVLILCCVLPPDCWCPWSFLSLGATAGHDIGISLLQILVLRFGIEGVDSVVYISTSGACPWFDYSRWVKVSMILNLLALRFNSFSCMLWVDRVHVYIDLINVVDIVPRSTSRKKTTFVCLEILWLVVLHLCLLQRPLLASYSNLKILILYIKE